MVTTAEGSAAAAAAAGSAGTQELNSTAGSNGREGGSSSSSSSSNTGSSGVEAGSSRRGLQVGLHWLVDDGSCLFIERQYDADGVLAEVRQGSAVKGGWSGGRM
jgi:hypothetical protein